MRAAWRLCTHRTALPLLASFALFAHAAPWERRDFTDSRNPPSYAVLGAYAQARVDLGHAVFNTQWVAAGTPNSARHDGLGPLFTAAACDACHNEGAHGQGPGGSGRLPASMIVQLQAGAAAGDPLYGHTMSTAALPGYWPEAVIDVRYSMRSGHYLDGQPWELREPHYEISQLRLGPLAHNTIVQPRLAPALFGVGLLDVIADAPRGHIGWQGASMSVRAQTVKALAQDMGLTSGDVDVDDCTPAQIDCRNAPNGGTPEVDADLLEALIEFQLTLAVPNSRVDVRKPPTTFWSTGCGGCHRPDAVIADAVGASAHISPFTDLRVYDLGPALADCDARGRSVASRWRTAPLWGLAYRLDRERTPTFLHDGRARSVEEAILWHEGEAAQARRHFMRLSQLQRQALVAWVGGL